MLTRRVDRSRGVKYLPKSDDRPRYYRVRTTKAKGLEKNCVTRNEAYEFLVVPLSLTDAKGGECYSVQSQINVPDHVGECHQNGLLREEDTQWSENLKCQATFNGLKQVMIKGPSLGIVDATKTPKVEAEQFSCVFGEYLHHCVDGRQKNWVQMPKVAQFGDRPQVHRVEEEWEQIADIARVCLEEASRPMREGVDREQCPLEFEWMTKLPINGATTSYDYLSTWTWRKTEKSRKPLLTDFKVLSLTAFIAYPSRMFYTFSRCLQVYLRNQLFLGYTSSESTNIGREKHCQSASCVFRFKLVGSPEWGVTHGAEQRNPWMISHQAPEVARDIVKGYVQESS
ncbi:RNA-directed DNA polymerase-like protein [Cucumis melo var. makuwa]|uniref:RNA-directed DNA polymerase-like protein n=1 Tax=Cucumis melo var. makuwa TaxID=1194695 RepID=A0A5A7UYQ8_CUCMM|nr:RNA-directed DNA polymerase-like protein [Cucumis melo var. makuwa]TYJ99799.1 RNA-directed DNA polymerase-like protein [Cucumis melo var. makuwa]